MSLPQTAGYEERIKFLMDNYFTPNPSQLFHYTNIEVCKSIIENQCFFATHIQFLNDWQEYSLGHKRLTEIWKEKIFKSNSIKKIKSVRNFKSDLKEFSDNCPQPSGYFDTMYKSKEDFSDIRRRFLPEVYSISFCSEGDSLNNWITYAKECGVCIEFDFSEFQFYDYALKQLWSTVPTILPTSQNLKFFTDAKLRRLVYSNDSDNEMIKIIEDAFEIFQEELQYVIAYEEPSYAKRFFWSYLAELYSIVPFFKSKSFSGEVEVRLAVRGKYGTYETSYNEEIEYFTPISYRISKNILIPYIKIGWEAKNVDANYPIKSITVGPGQNQERVYEGLIHFLEHQEDNIISRKSFQTVIKEDNSYTTTQGIKVKRSSVSYIF